MVSGIDEGSPGDKTKVMTMMEGFGDPVTNDYRFTFEKRGRDYVTPGAVTWRIITGDSGNQSAMAARDSSSRPARRSRSARAEWNRW